MSPKPLIRKIIARSLLVAALAAWLSCSQQGNPPPGHVTMVDDGHGLHVVNNAQLRGIMDELRRLDLERISNEIRVGRQEADEKLAKVARAAASLAGDARVIPMVFKNLEMSPESRRVFDELAAKLQLQCDDLRRLAGSHQPRGINAKLSAIIQTCNDCHASFRGPQMAARPGANPIS